MRLLLLLPLLGFVSCGDEGDAPDTPAIVRLKLQPENESFSRGDQAPESYWKYECQGPVEAPWKMVEGWEAPRAYDGSIAGIPEEKGGWLVTGRTVFEVDGEYDPTKFNQAVVTLSTPQSCDVGMVGRGRGSKTVRSPRAPARNEGEHQVVVDLSGFRALEEFRSWQLMIHPRNCKAVVLHSIELIQINQDHFLPPLGEQGCVPDGDGSRSGYTLFEGATLSASGLAGADAHLEFDGVIPVASWNGPTEILVVAKRSDGTSKEFRARFEAPDFWVPFRERLAPGEWRIQVAIAPSSDSTSAFIASPRIERAIDDPPAVVLVTSDTHRADTLGLEDQTKTPFLDRLAQNGVYYRDCFASTNITNPSHVSILTGLSVCETGISDNTTALTERSRTLAEAFQEAGYYTFASLSSKHLNHRQSGLGQGFDRVTAPALATIDSPVSLAWAEQEFERSANRPLFAWLHIFDAHTPYVVPDKYKNLYYDASRDPYDKSLPELPKDALAKWDHELRDPDFIRAQYRSEVTFLDEQLARTLAHPRVKDAVIALTSDHGEHLGNHGIYWSHHGLFPETLAVPMILSGPGVPQGVVVETAVENLNVGRTLLDLAGQQDLSYPGRSLLEYAGEDAPSGAPRFSLASHGHGASLEWKGWYLVLNMSRHRVPPREKGDVELYYLPEDPTCMTDLAAQEPERTKQMLARVLEWLDRGQPGAMGRSIEMNEQMLEDLAALGYATELEANESERWFTPPPNWEFAEED